MTAYGLIGKSLKHSFSKDYFTKKFEKEGINAAYQNFEVESAEMILSLLSENHAIRGLNVTIPFKETILPFLDEIDADALKIQAVNTIKIDRSESLKLTGFNTDHIGFSQSLKPLLESRSKIKALILGSGGAAQAVKYAVKSLGIEFQVVSRTPNSSAIAYNQLSKDIIRNHQLIINTTPLGMVPYTDSSPAIPYQFLTQAHICYDLIYNPGETSFLKNAGQQGCTIKNGYEMLELQAEASWKIWNT